MNAERELVKLGQIHLEEKGFYPGPADGIVGKLTREALSQYLGSLGSAEPPLSRRTEEIDGRTNVGAGFKLDWPEDNFTALCAYYGRPGDESRLVKFEFPYPMVLAWDLGTVVTWTRVHERVAGSLKRIFNNIRRAYPDDKALRAAGLDLWGGCYNARKMRGGNQWSRHAWGIAVDIDPSNNGLYTQRHAARMPDQVIEIFEAEGWKSGGRAWGRDFMHFQATK